ncbi:MAG: hypothetical protein IAI49_01070 [Candidatus Eremiobacteraeota bacterium]|nr:hypothetical protein [Candidatus Eremiobacteraeota bacterium]
MHRIRFLACLFLVLAAAGCKTSTPLAVATARSLLESGPFSAASATQFATFSSGSLEAQPLAIDQFLYAKHWTACVTEPGALSSTATCTLDTEGETYGRANAWTATPAPVPNCPKCVGWAIPIARAMLRSLAVSVADKTHATIDYTYVVTPNEFGASFGAWTAGHVLSWCGPDPAAVGGWATSRHGTATVVKANDAWTLVEPPGTFASTFALTGDSTRKACAR